MLLVYDTSTTSRPRVAATRALSRSMMAPTPTWPAVQERLIDELGCREGKAARRGERPTMASVVLVVAVVEVEVVVVAVVEVEVVEVALVVVVVA